MACRHVQAVTPLGGRFDAKRVGRALIGKPTILDLNTLNIYESDVGAIFDEAVLPAGPLSTWVEFSENEITLQRVGAISLEQLQALVPTISAPTL